MTQLVPLVNQLTMELTTLANASDGTTSSESCLDVSISEDDEADGESQYIDGVFRKEENALNNSSDL